MEMQYRQTDRLTKGDAFKLPFRIPYLYTKFLFFTLAIFAQIVRVKRKAC